MDPASPNAMWGSRTRLPASVNPKGETTIWAFLRQCIGKELSKISMPIHFNEPLSFLQRVTEYMEYSELIVLADQEKDVLRRLEYVTAFAVSASASNWDRQGKPFNPLLCETFEYHGKDYRMVAEQVSHHPPVSAFHAEGAHFRFHGCICPRLRFWGKTVEVKPRGKLTLELLRHGEVYEWQYVDCCVHNIIVGSLWVEHTGDMEVRNVTTGHCTQLTWHPMGWFSTAQLHKVDGFLYHPDGKTRLRKIYGMWTQAMFSADVDPEESEVGSPIRLVQNSVASDNHDGDGDAEDYTKPPQVAEEEPPPVVDMQSLTCDLHLPGQRLLWRAVPKLPDAKESFNLPTFAMHLNELTQELAAARARSEDPQSGPLLPPTDTRFRPDMRLMEEGDMERAADEKSRLEAKQREARSLKEEAERKSANRRSSGIRNSISAPSLFAKLLYNGSSSTPSPSGNSAVRSTTSESDESPPSVLHSGPLWFVPGPEHNEKKQIYSWLFTGDYWKREWSRCPNIY